MTALNEMTKEQLIALVATMKAQPARKVSFKVTQSKTNDKGETVGTSGAVSCYGLGRFPITLYKSQWEALFAAIPDLQAFMKANAPLLATKQ